MEQPQGFLNEGHENKVLRLKKALYGLKQAPRAWDSRPDKYLKMASQGAFLNMHFMLRKKRMIFNLYAFMWMISFLQEIIHKFMVIFKRRWLKSLR